MKRDGTIASLFLCNTKDNNLILFNKKFCQLVIGCLVI